MFYSFRLNFQLHRYRRANGQRYFFLSRARFLVCFFFPPNRPRLSHVMATWHETSSFPVSKRLSHTSVKACLVMAGRYLALVLLFWGSFSVMVNGKCPCEDESLCEPIARPPGKEFLMFSTKPYVWKKYDWTKVTTIALFRPWDDELMCEAHKRVRNQLISLSIILLTLFAGLLLCKSTKSVLSKLERAHILACDSRWQFLTSFLWNLRKKILLLCSHRETFRCVRQRLNTSLKNNPFFSRNLKTIWCRSWINTQISLHSDAIDWSQIDPTQCQLNLYSNNLITLTEVETNLKKTRQFGALRVE